MDTIKLELTKEEVTAVRFLMGGAPHMPNITPPQRLAAQDVLTKVNDAIAAANEPEPEPAAEEVAPISASDPMPNLKEVLHLDDVKAAIPEEVPDTSKVPSAA